MEKDKDFSKIYHIVVDSGILSKLNGKEAKIYIVLCRYADYVTGISKPTVMTISRLSGVSKNDVKKAVDKLEAMGLILTERTGERFQFRRIYGVIRRDWIEPTFALSVIPARDKGRIKISRDNKGRFLGVPETSDSPIPAIMDAETTANKEKSYPENAEQRIIPENTEKIESVLENGSRDTSLEEKTEGKTHPESGKGPVSKIVEYARKNGFREAMKLQMINKRNTVEDEFEKEEARKNEEAREFFKTKKDGRSICSTTG